MIVLKEYPFAYAGDFLLGQKEWTGESQEPVGIPPLEGEQAYSA